MAGASIFSRGIKTMLDKSNLIRRLQYSQRIHDENFHPEIARLDTGRRVVHLVLHLAKYAGDMRLASLTANAPRYRRALIDCAVITVSAATALHIDLSDHFPHESHFSSKYEFQDDFAIGVGRLAKAAESLDHVEAYPSRQVWNEEFPRLFTLVCNEIHGSGGDLFLEVSQRLEGVRRKHIFYTEIMSGINNGILE